MKIKSVKNEDGSSLILLLLLITVVSILGLSLYRMSLNQYQNTIREEKRVQAYYIAKSGANLVASAIENDLIIPEELDQKSSEPYSINDGYFTVKVKHNENITTITSIGTIDNLSQEVMVELARFSNYDQLPNLDHAIFSDGELNIGHIDIKGDIGINKHNNIQKPIEITNVNATINGDIYVGPNGSPHDIDSRDIYDGHNGEIYNLPERQEFVIPQYPAFPEIKPENKYDELLVDINNEETTIIDSSIWYDKININDNLTINVGDDDILIRTREFIVGGGREVIINRYGDGKVKLFIEEKITLNSNVNLNGSPEDLYMYYSGVDDINFTGNDVFVGSAFIEKADIKLSGSGGITGNITSTGNNISITGNSEANVRAIYAPESEISMEGNAFVRGAIVGKDVNIKGGNKIIYDDSMIDINPEDLGFEVIEEYNRTWR